MLTDQELKGIGAQALNMARRDVERNQFNFLFGSYHVGDIPPLHRMKKIEALVIERLGEDWLNYGGRKDAGFAVLRKAVDIMPPDAVVFAMAINNFKPTAQFYELPAARRAEFLKGGHDQQHRGVAEGLFTLHDGICAVVQTPERVCNYLQEVDERRRPTGKPEVRCFPQEDFDGRLKMFGGHYFEVPPFAKGGPAR